MQIRNLIVLDTGMRRADRVELPNKPDLSGNPTRIVVKIVELVATPKS
jgi:hypothetical protein